MLVKGRGLSVMVGLVVEGIEDLYFREALNKDTTVSTTLALTGNLSGGGPLDMEMSTGEQRFFESNASLTGSDLHEAAFNFPADFSSGVFNSLARHTSPEAEVFAIKENSRSVGDGNWNTIVLRFDDSGFVIAGRLDFKVFEAHLLVYSGMDLQTDRAFFRHGRGHVVVDEFAVEVGDDTVVDHTDFQCVPFTQLVRRFDLVGLNRVFPLKIFGTVYAAREVNLQRSGNADLNLVARSADEDSRVIVGGVCLKIEVQFVVIVVGLGPEHGTLLIWIVSDNLSV